LERFPYLTTKEVQIMLQLTPFDETVIGKELIERGREEGKIEGELIGRIKMAQELLKRNIVSDEELAKKSVDELQNIFDS
jgi:predicted transposase YdaD